MPKLRQIARIIKGNKKDFKPNLLTEAMAKRQAKKDIKIGKIKG